MMSLNQASVLINNVTIRQFDNLPMQKTGENIILKKTIEFSLAIIEYAELLEQQRKFVIGGQLLRSGTSIGANVHEAISGESKRDFIHKLSIALKEAKETSYWLNLLNDSKYISIEQFNDLNASCSEIIRIHNSIILTTKAKYFNKPTLNS